MREKEQGANRPRPAVTRATIDKTIATIVMTAFLWTFCGIYEIAFAASSDALAKPENKKHTKREDSVEKKFGDTIDTIEEIIEEIGKAEIPEHRQTQKDRLRIKRAEIEEYDKEIKKTFRETEEKIKDLPEEIKKRHRTFVQHYEKNIEELKDHIQAIHKATSKAEIKEAVQKTKTFLQKKRPKKKHIPLDPNKLPHRTAEPVKIKPRLKKEEFRNDGDKRMAFGDQLAEPLLVAANGSLDGLLSSDSELLNNNVHSDPLAGFPTGEYLLALADTPTDADLAETIEVRFTDAIKAKAAELEHNPVKIYNWVRNNIEYVPTYGSIQGADYCLQTKQCNAFDTASLLIALLRASDIHARYVYGTIEMPMDKLMNWAGGFTDANAALSFIASGGIPVTGVMEGGKIAKVRMEHVWTEAWVDYIPSRGSRHRRGDTWIPLDASYKQYEYTRGMDMYQLMGINGEQYIMDYITDPTAADLADIYPDYVTSPYQFYSKRLLDILDTAYPTADNIDIFGGWSTGDSKRVIKHEFPILMGTLPYKTEIVSGRYRELPGSMRPIVSFTIDNARTYETVITYSAALVELAGKRLTLSYVPATSNDEALAESYGGLLNVPPYLINVKPLIKVGGVTVATGGPVGLGYDQDFSMSFSIPNLGSDTVRNKVTAGDYSAIAIDYFRIPADVVAENMTVLKDNLGDADVDGKLGQILYAMGVAYFHHLNFEEMVYAKNFQTAVSREPSEAMVTAKTNVTWLWGIPYKVSEGGVTIDADRNIYKPVPLDGSGARKRDFMLVSGLGSSARESMVLERFLGVSAVSAAKILRKAHGEGILIHTVDKNNIDAMIPVFNISSDAIGDIRNAVNAGKKVIVPERETRYGQWKGVCYIVLDPMTGAGGYMIEGGLSGGATETPINRNDYSALWTVYGRDAIVKAANTWIDTPYVYGSHDPNCGGFDCSGFVQYMHYIIYGDSIFGGITAKSKMDVSGIYKRCFDKKWLHPYSERLPGDIVFLLDNGHTGIYIGNDQMIHASARVGWDDCEGYDDITTASIPLGCSLLGKTDDIWRPVCGKFQRVVKTPNTIASFYGNYGGEGAIDDEICRPVP